MSLQGHGIGLRPEHYAEVVALVGCRERAQRTGLDWVEVISENFFEPGGNPRRVLRAVREHVPIAMHGVSLSIGSVDPLDERYLAKLSALEREIEPALVSDHLCWGSVDGRYAHDLLPLPYTDEALVHVAARVIAVQDRLRRPLVLENVSSYLTFAHATMSELEFLRALIELTDCRVLLDVNNVFVSAHNHEFDAVEFIVGLPRGCVAQMHLAGHRSSGTLLLDTHDAPVCEDVWSLYRQAVRTHGPVATCIEWDDALPTLDRLLAESAQAADVAREVRAHV